MITDKVLRANIVDKDRRIKEKVWSMKIEHIKKN